MQTGPLGWSSRACTLVATSIRSSCPTRSRTVRVEYCGPSVTLAVGVRPDGTDVDGPDADGPDPVGGAADDAADDDAWEDAGDDPDDETEVVSDDVASGPALRSDPQAVALSTRAPAAADVATTRVVVRTAVLGATRRKMTRAMGMALLTTAYRP